MEPYFLATPTNAPASPSGVLDENGVIHLGVTGQSNSFASVPEVDATSATAAITLLIGMFAVTYDRRKCQ